MTEDMTEDEFRAELVWLEGRIAESLAKSRLSAGVVIIPDDPSGLFDDDAT